MKLNKITAFLIASILVVSQVIPVAAEETDLLSSAVSPGYNLQVQDAIYSAETFESDASYEKTGAGTAEVAFIGSSYGNALKISGETEVSYEVVGKPENTDYWTGDVSVGFSGEGTESSPFLIESGADLKFFANKVNSGEKYEGKYLKLTKNIDLQNNNWVPIGDGSTYSFNGVFDGNGFVVSNIKIVGANGGTSIGFFGYVNGTSSMIKNLGIENVSITYENTSSPSIANAGGMIGTLYGKIKGCYAKNVTIRNTSTTTATGWVGGLVGRIRSTINSATEPVMSECYVVDFYHYTNVKSDSALVAPLFGQMHSSTNNILFVENCYVAGDYISDSKYFYQTGTGNQNAYTYSKNVYAAHGVTEVTPTTDLKTDIVKPSGTRRVNVGSILPNALNASLFAESFIDDTTGLVNGGYPYHEGRIYIPEEAKLGFDINFDSSDEIYLEIKNGSGNICVQATIDNTFASGWHNVVIDMQNGQYTISVDDQDVSGGNLFADAGNSKIIFTQVAGKTFYIDNITVSKDFTEELTEFADNLITEAMNGESSDNVNRNLNFKKNFNDVVVEWSSSNDKIIDEKGVIQKKAVRLSAVVSAEFSAKTKASVQLPTANMEFTVTVAANDGATDEEKVNDIALYYLKESVLTDESMDAITHNLYLPSEYEEATITWETSDSSIVTNEGVITLPEIDGTDAEATLTALIEINGVTRTVEFDIVVPAPLSDYSKVKLAANSIAYTDITSEDVNKITSKLTFPTKGMFDTTITWESFDTSAIANNGTVTRGEVDTFVQVKATVELDGTTYERIFSFNVLLSDEAAANVDADLITEIPAETDSSFELPLVGMQYGAVIGWTSYDDTIVIDEDYAIVTRPSNVAGDKVVTLTAELTFGQATVTREFSVTVVKLPPADQLISSAMGSITWESISPDSISAVENNLSLPKNFGNGITANWSSSPVGYIDENGVVTRPAKGSSDVAVILTAVVGEGIEGAEPQSISFDLTIKAFASDEDALRKAADELAFSVLSSENLNMVTSDLFLPTAWRYGTEITWSSSNENYIRISESDRTGFVTLPETGTANETVTITATLSLNGLTREKHFFITLAEPDFVKDLYSVDVESFELGTFAGAGNINVNKNNYVRTSVVEDPTNTENKVLRLQKDSTSPKYAQRKGFKLSTVDEKKGNFEFTGKFFFEKLPDKSFAIIGDFTTGEEFTLTFAKSDDNVKIGTFEFPMNEWLEIKICFDSFEKVYSLYVNNQAVYVDKNFKYKVDKPIETSFLYFWFDFVYTDAVVAEHIVYVDDLKSIKNVSSKDTLLEAATRFETEFLTMNDIRNISSDLHIPVISLFETTVETKSSNTSVISDEGKVTRPVKGDAEVQFTATYINKFGNTRTKTFDLLVKGGVSEDIEDSVALQNDLDSAINYILDNHNVNYITQDMDLLFEGAYGSDISYISSNADILTNEGIVTRPKNKDTEVTLTVIAERDGETTSRSIRLVVKKAPSNGPGGGSGSGSSGSSSSSSGGTSTVPKGDVSEILPNQPTQSAPSAIFTDISNHWARTYIEEMYREGIVNGKEDGSFDPDATVTREEFITMLVRVLGIEANDKTGIFTDISSGDWFAPFVNAAYKNNIVNGVSADKFGVGANISRQDMCVMVYNALGEKFKKNDSSETFADDSSISAYAKTSVYALKYNGIVNGRGENNFAPNGTATRAEAVKIIYTIKEAFVD